MWQLIWLSILSWLNFTGIVIEEKMLIRDSKPDSITSNKYHWNIQEIMNNNEIWNLIVTLTQKKAYFKLMGKNK